MVVDRATIFQNVQLGLETVPGTAVPTTKKLNSLSIEPAVQLETTPFRARGNKYASLVVPNREWVSANVTGQPTYTELPYVLASAVKKVAPSTVGASTKRWVFSSAPSSPDLVQTYTMEQGDPFTEAERMAYALFTGVEMNFSRTELALSATVMAQAFQTSIFMGTDEVQTLTVDTPPGSGGYIITFAGQATASIAHTANAATIQAAIDLLSNVDPGDIIVTGGPITTTPVVLHFSGQYAQVDVALVTVADTFDVGVITVAAVAGVPITELDLVPILPTQLNFYLADTYAGLAAAPVLERAFTAAWRLNDRFGPVWPVNRAHASYAGHVEIEPTFEFELGIEADAIGMALHTAMRLGSKKFLRIEAVGIPTEVGQTYLLQLDLCGSISAMSDPQDFDGVFGYNYTFTGVKDATWTKAFEVIVQNLLASL